MRGQPGGLVALSTTHPGVNVEKTSTPGMIKSGFDAAQRMLKNRWVTQDRGQKELRAAAEADK